MPEEIKALIALAPSDVDIVKEHAWRYRVESSNERRTSSRWMSPQHTLEEWVFAINQVRKSL